MPLRKGGIFFFNAKARRCQDAKLFKVLCAFPSLRLSVEYFFSPMIVFTKSFRILL